MNRNLSYNAGKNQKNTRKSTWGRKKKSDFSPFKEKYEKLEQEPHLNTEAAPKAEAKPETEAKQKTEAKSKSFKKKKRPAARKRVSFPLFLLIVIIAAVFLLINVFLRTAFNKVQNYKMDKSNVVTVQEDKNMENYRTIALFGVDDQDNEIHDKGSRTDSIIIFCVNKHGRDAKLLSIYRDTYVSINGQYDKINAAHAYGGPELAISTINRNLDLNITDFATINFKALADAVNIVGGIQLTVKSEKELENLNDYIGNMNKINGGESPKFDMPASFPFTATFDGNQAVAYSRIRYMAGGDHERANHQRIVINELFHAMTKKPWKIMDLINTVLPQCKTSLSSKDFAKLTQQLVGSKIEDSSAYPFEGHSVDEKYNGIYYGFPITVRENVIMAHEYLFGTKDYQPSEELERISEKVQNITDTLSY